jgi:hypothetical protein
MNSPRRTVVICLACALLAAGAAVTFALSGPGSGERHRPGQSRPATPAIRHAQAPARSAATAPEASTRSKPGRRTRHVPHWLAAAPHWQSPALATARSFVRWFDRWLAGEATARQAPNVTAAYAAKLRASVNHVPPAAQGHVASITHLIPAAMPPNAANPREAWIYTATRSQGAVIQFTVQERLHAGRWQVYDLYQGP